VAGTGVNLASLVRGHRAEAPAVHDGERWTTWGELRAGAAGVAGALAGLGVGPGDRVAVGWPTSVEFVACYLGTLAAGAVAVPLNPASPVPELSGELARVRPGAVLGDPGGSATLTEAAAGLGLPVLGVVPAGGADAFDPVDREDDDPAVLLFTSGTAGEPRPAVLGHGNLRANLEQMLALPGEMARADDVGFSAVPLSHVFGLNVALGLTLATGASLVLQERFDAPASLELMARESVTWLLGVPAMFAAWAALAGGPGSDGLARVRRAVSGAAALAPEIAAGFEARTGVPLWQGYGLTEASPAVATSVGTGRNRPGSVGRALPGVELRLVDEAGADVLVGDPGEIWVRGPNVFQGYYEDPAATAEVLDGEGWLHTGDVAVVGDDGDLFVVDRRKDLVIVSGFNVFPAEVEKVARAVPGVADAVVVGRPDPQTGEAVELVVVRGETGAALTEEQLRAACRASLARYKCPSSVRFVERLPLGLTGKALRRALREEQPA
jgi:long-chain acyl-CoA synthetase